MGLCVLHLSNSYEMLHQVRADMTSDPRQGVELIIKIGFLVTKYTNWNCSIKKTVDQGASGFLFQECESLIEVCKYMFFVFTAIWKKKEMSHLLIRFERYEDSLNQSVQRYLVRSDYLSGTVFDIIVTSRAGAGGL